MAFASEPLRPAGDAIETGAHARGEPALPSAFTRGDERLAIATILRTWRSTKTDRGDDYLARLWYEVALEDGRIAVIYFDRKARRDQPHWWLFTVRPSTP